MPQTHPSLPQLEAQGASKICAHETCVQVQSTALKDVSAAPRPPAGPMSILLSANRNLDNPNPGFFGLRSQYKIPGLGIEMRRGQK